LAGEIRQDRRIASRKGAKVAKFGEIKVGAAKKSWEAARGLRELSVLAGKEFRRSVSRKGAKVAKFGEINVGAAKKKWLGGGAFAYLASWREKVGRNFTRAKTQRAPSSEKSK